MFLLDNLLFAPVKGLAAVCRKVQDAVEQDLESREKSMMAQLAELHRLLESGEVTEEVFDARENELLDQLAPCGGVERATVVIAKGIAVTQKLVPMAADDDSLVELLDRLLHQGVVLCGEVAISVADVDLVYLRLQLVLSSVERARQVGWYQPVRTLSPTPAPPCQGRPRPTGRGCE